MRFLALSTLILLHRVFCVLLFRLLHPPVHVIRLVISFSAPFLTHSPLLSLLIVPPSTIPPSRRYFSTLRYIILSHPLKDAALNYLYFEIPLLPRTTPEM